MKKSVPFNLVHKLHNYSYCNNNQHIYIKMVSFFESKSSRVQTTVQMIDLTTWFHANLQFIILTMTILSTWHFLNVFFFCISIFELNVLNDNQTFSSHRWLRNICQENNVQINSIQWPHFNSLHLFNLIPSTFRQSSVIFKNTMSIPHNLLVIKTLMWTLTRKENYLLNVIKRNIIISDDIYLFLY